MSWLFPRLLNTTAMRYALAGAKRRAFCAKPDVPRAEGRGRPGCVNWTRPCPRSRPRWTRPWPRSRPRQTRPWPTYEVVVEVVFTADEVVGNCAPTANEAVKGLPKTLPPSVPRTSSRYSRGRQSSPPSWMSPADGRGSCRRGRTAYTTAGSAPRFYSHAPGTVPPWLQQ